MNYDFEDNPNNHDKAGSLIYLVSMVLSCKTYYKVESRVRSTLTEQKMYMLSLTLGEKIYSTADDMYQHRLNNQR